MGDPYNLDRFVEAQRDVYAGVRQELAAGRKTGHWMWFIFPQLRGLGHSRMATVFGISSRAEAEAYLAHSVLGPRLEECTRLVNEVKGRSAEDIFGGTDAMKFRSSMTLFAAVGGANAIFKDALDKYFGGVPDPLTAARLDDRCDG